VGYKCGLQRSLFAKVECEQKFGFHQGVETSVKGDRLRSLCGKVSRQYVPNKVYLDEAGSCG
jgi:hypothetical protein